MFPPSRIVCLTEETVETLYLLGEQDRIVGISGYVERPPQARQEKPRVSAFTSVNIEKILALRPNLVLTFSDLQAEHRRRYDPPWDRSARLQPAGHSRDPRHDLHDRSNGGRK
jgi:ABC-type Fe3+-hydroxamate transport system substrate-binding protein